MCKTVEEMGRCISKNDKYTMELCVKRIEKRLKN